MSQRIINTQDLAFQLFELHDVEQILGYDRYAEHNRETLQAALDLALKVAVEEFAPHARLVDEEEPTFENGRVSMRPEVKKALDVLRDTGLMAAGQDFERGGMQLPAAVAQMCVGLLKGANVGTQGYAGLTIAAANLIKAQGNEYQQKKYAEPMMAGRFFGTMCLTEPHSGTDLGILRTKAEPNDDGSFNITGTKIFITGGEHDMTSNHIHLVLAKLPDAPAGSKGISLFLVPKFLPDADNNAGEGNGATCGSIEHKMGIKGSATCVMNFDDAKGWIIGEPNQGLACMFTMMNYERLSIGLQGLGLGEVSYQSAVDYARERLQGRSATGAKNPNGPADPIIVHGDVRRMLMNMRAINEGGRALAAYVGMQLDTAKFSEDADVKKKAEDRVALLTPVAKAFFTDRGLDTTITGQQVFGGHGYIREWGMEQFVRDCRISQIYEGTNGIQALDLAGRKVARNGGKSVDAFLADAQAWVEENSGNGQLAAISSELQAALTLLKDATDELLSQAGNNPDAISAAAVEYLDLFGYVLYAWLWAQMLAATDGRDDDFAKAKRITCQYYFQRILPKAHALYAQIKSGADTMMGLDGELF